MGGQAIPNFDYALAPYVAKSYIKNCEQFLDIKINAARKDLKEYIEKPMFEYIKQYRHVMNNEGYAALKTCIENLFDHMQLAQPIPMDDLMAYAERKTNDDTYQAMEGMVHNFCSLASRAGSQVPFSSINFGTDTTPEGRMVIKNILLATKAGLGNGETAIFPISIFRMRKGITDKGSPNYDLFQLACEVSALRLYPENRGNMVA